MENNNNNNQNNPNIRHTNSLQESVAAHRQAEEEALKTGRSSIIFDRDTMSQERLNGLINRLASRAGIVNGTERGNEVRNILGNAMSARFSEGVSDNEGNSSEEENNHRNRVNRNNNRNNNGGGGRG